MANRLLESELLPAKDSLGRLNSTQRQLWDHFYSSSKDIAPLQKSQISPEKLIPFLRNIWMADIHYTEDGKITLLIMRLLGTALTNHYGELTGHQLIEEDKLTDFAEKFPDYHKRMKQVSTELIKHNEPLLAVSRYSSNVEGQEINSTALVFPMCRKGDNVDMVFGFTETVISKAGIKISA